jgi:hypothetical protein
MAASRSLSQFLFDVAAWRGSRAIQRMSFAERGVYFEMLLEQWEKRALPDSVEQVADAIAGSDAQAAEVLAAWPNVRRKFLTNTRGEIFNDALERTRRKQRAYRKSKEEAGREGGKAKAVNRTKDSELSASTNVAVLADATAEPSGKEEVREVERREGRGSEERLDGTGVLAFPCDGSTRTWTLTDAQVQAWSEAYPSLDVLAECRKALVWVQANRRKTARGMPAFLVGWLNRATNDPRSAKRAATSIHESETARHNAAVLEEWQRQLHAQEGTRGH